MVEADLENWARGRIFEAGGLMMKWVSPSVKGIPDNICFWPERVIHFLEFKWQDSRIENLQKIIHQQLARYGHTVRIVRDYEWVERYVERYRPR